MNEWASGRRESIEVVVVVGKTGFYGDLMRRAVASGSEPPRFIPQEGFLDELLFGRDWWNDEVALLNATLNHHAGLRYAKSLESVAGPNRLRKKFRWPSTEAQETKKPVLDNADYRESTPLFELGYRVSGMTRRQRWEVLTRKALPQLGLKEVAETIANHCRTRKRQKGGSERFANAIAEWEHDLARLKTEFYVGQRSRFVWPRTEP